MTRRTIASKYPSEYISWLAMKQRCYYEPNKRYADYGGRGITVCERWVNSFENFFSDLGQKPSENHTLDRIDVEGNYEPSNCRWSSPFVQAANKRTYKNNKSGYKGVCQRSDTGKWQANINRSGKRIYLGQYDSEKGAIAARREAEELLRVYG